MTSVRHRFTPLAFLVLLATLLLLPARADAVVGSNCQALRVPVSVTGVPGATIYGELCRPPSVARGVQLLVHGATYDHNYWDWPDNRSTYSYVLKANAAGYATFNVDRLGIGESTHPAASTSVNIDTDSEALHGVIEGLRKGTVGGRPYKRVIWVGHSLGTVMGWVEAARYGDVDAFVLTGMTHAAEPTWIENATGNVYPAALDPKFANSGLEPGYLTTEPGVRAGMFYYQPGADPNVIARDEALKQTVTVSELETATPMFAAPAAETAPSRTIHVPTLVVVGQHDAMACAAGCTAAALKAREAPYYSPQARMQILVAPNAGHDMQLHRTAPLTSIRILRWLAGTR